MRLSFASAILTRKETCNEGNTKKKKKILNPKVFAL
jgi:hypothetical protein